MNAYEMTFIVRSDRDEDQIRSVVDTITGRIESDGGEILATIPWNPPRRRMAYPIRDFRDGFYVTTVFNLDGQALRPIENALKLNDNILRYLLVQATDTMVKQAQQRVHQAAAAAAPREPVAQPQPDLAPGDDAAREPELAAQDLAAPSEETTTSKETAATSLETTDSAAVATDTPTDATTEAIDSQPEPVAVAPGATTTEAPEE